MTEGSGSKRRILITGVARFLGLRLAKRLEGDPAVESLIGVDVQEPPLHIDGLDFIRADIRSPLIARVIESTEADTLVHTNISSSPASLGGRSQMKENNVIGTMQLLAAAQRSNKLQRVVVKSSTAIYGSGPGEPSVIPEDHAARQVDLTGYGRDCAEAETYARDFGRRRRDVELVILRTQNVIGPTVQNSLMTYLSLPLIPTALGFDPRLQLLHEEDAVDALYASVFGDGRGIFNVAADGIVYLSKAIRMRGAIQLPLVLPAATSAAGVLRALKVVDFSSDQLRLLLYGRVVATDRFEEAFDWAPRYTTEEALMDLGARSDNGGLVASAPRPRWQLALLNHLRQRSDPVKESV